MSGPPAGPPPPGWPPPPGAQPPPAWPAPPGQPWQPPPAGSYGTASAAPQPSSEAITALVLAIGAWLCFPLGFVAVFVGAQARKRARENPATVGGEQMALAAMIIGGALAGLQFVFTLAYLAIAIVYGFMHSP